MTKPPAKCPVCAGAGKTSSGITCPKCCGEGVVRPIERKEKEPR